MFKPVRAERFKLEKATEFVCTRCRNTKVSKNYYVFHGAIGEKSTVCNGCYGEMFSKGEAPRAEFAESP